VRRQSEVDVDFGLFLSGGLDSSLITAVTRSIRPEKTLKAYSLRFSEASYDEGHYAEQVANTLGVEFVPVWVRPKIFRPPSPNWFGKLANRWPIQPGCLALFLPVVLRQDVRVALVGEGADELFGGYPTYFGAGLAGIMRGFPIQSGHLLDVRVESWPASDKKVTIPFLLKRFIQGDELDYLGRHILWTSCISPAILTRLGITPPLIRRPSYLSAKCWIDCNSMIWKLHWLKDY